MTPSCTRNRPLSKASLFHPEAGWLNLASWQPKMMRTFEQVAINILSSVKFMPEQQNLETATRDARRCYFLSRVVNLSMFEVSSERVWLLSWAKSLVMAIWCAWMSFSCLPSSTSQITTVPSSKMETSMADRWIFQRCLLTKNARWPGSRQRLPTSPNSEAAAWPKTSQSLAKSLWWPSLAAARQWKGSFLAVETARSWCDSG